MKKSYIPNMFTFINLCLGIMSILVAMEGNFKNAAVFIVAAGLVDRYDGRIARMLKAESSIGRELDSLADNVSFGVAPAIMVYLMFNLKTYGLIGLSVILLYCVSGCYRLARYNSLQFTGTFSGVPITIAGTAIAIFTLLLGEESNIYPPIVIFVMLLFSYLMVSNIHIKKR